jgi:hypothetical protein
MPPRDRAIHSISDSAALAGAARYFPLDSGRYEVAVGLRKLGTDFGNGEADKLVFQIDRLYGQYRTEKLQGRRERLSKYFCRAGQSETAHQALLRFLVTRLPAEHPRYFFLEETEAAGYALHCALSGETLILDGELRLLDTRVDRQQQTKPYPPYNSALDAVAAQLQEDIALVEVNGSDHDRLTALHLCFPNHWSAEDKIGGSFGAVHAAVPGFERIARQSNKLLNGLVRDGPFVRFAWGLATDTRLNHHPQRPSNSPTATDWHGRNFDSERPELFLRIERQVTHGLPEANAFLFTIRTYLEHVSSLSQNEIKLLRQAIETMNPETLRYKGLASHTTEILTWLGQLEEPGDNA